MAYLTVADIERELSLDFSATTEPTDTEISEFITQVEAELNGVLASVGVTVPVFSTSSPYSYAMIRQAATFGVCARVLGAYTGIATEEAPREAAYWQRYRDFLDQIKEDPAILFDASFGSSDVRVDGITDSDDEYHEAYFEMDMEF